MFRTPKRGSRRWGRWGADRDHGGNSGEGAAMPLGLHRLPHVNSTGQLTASPPRGSSARPGTEEDGGSKGTEGGHMKVETHAEPPNELPECTQPGL